MVSGKWNVFLAMGLDYRHEQLNKDVNGDIRLAGLTTFLPKAALLSCARFTCDIYDKFFLLSLNNEEVQKLRSKL